MPDLDDLRGYHWYWKENFNTNDLRGHPGRTYLASLRRAEGMAMLTDAGKEWGDKRYMDNISHDRGCPRRNGYGICNCSLAGSLEDPASFIAFHDLGQRIRLLNQQAKDNSKRALELYDRSTKNLRWVVFFHQIRFWRESRAIQRGLGEVNAETKRIDAEILKWDREMCEGR